MSKSLQTENRVVLPDVSWQQFEKLLQELGSDRTARLTYDRGKLEMMTPLPEHDRCTKLIESLILVLVDELHLTIETVAPILLQAADRGRVTELNAGYYFDASPVLMGKNAVDLAQGEPPELAIEISLTKSSLDKFRIYADLGIPELWRYSTKAGDDVLKGNLQMYRLQDQQYVESASSAVFPFLPAQRVLQFIDQSDKVGLVQALDVLRHWTREML
ncbi:MAG TPA: Uma2 family endonuclease [Crinalium sp.]|jgi:Uma2 family endonuclease